jgi:site-specific recombinase XerD
VTDQELFEAFEEYQRGRGLSPSTMERRRGSLRGFTRYMTPRSITTAKPADVDKWLTRLKSQGTKGAYFSDLKSFFLWAHRRELIPVNPMMMCDAPRRSKLLPKPARAEVIGLAVAMSSGPLQLMILLGALAGLRVGEIAAMSSEDIFLDREPPVLMVRQGKGGKDRVVPLHPILQERLRGIDHGWLFPPHTADRDHISAQYASKQVGKALSAASEGNQRVTSHSLRHYFASEAMKWSKGNIILVGGLLGHGDPSTTMGYSAWLPTDGMEVVARIGTGQRVDVPDELARVRRPA